LRLSLQVEEAAVCIVPRGTSARGSGSKLGIVPRGTLGAGGDEKDPTVGFRDVELGLVRKCGKGWCGGVTCEEDKLMDSAGFGGDESSGHVVYGAKGDGVELTGRGKGFGAMGPDFGA
jgi:hypothetical protein